MTTSIFTSLPGSIVRKSIWINSNRWVAVMGHNSVFYSLCLKFEHLSQVWIWFSISAVIPAHRIYLLKGLKIFLTLDDPCHHSKLLWLVVCNSEPIQTVMVADYMYGTVFSCTEGYSWEWVDVYVWAWFSVLLNHYYVLFINSFSYSAVSF